MAGKVVHVTDEAHQVAKEYCEKYNKEMQSFVSELILKEVNTSQLPTPKSDPVIVDVVGPDMKQPIPEKPDDYENPYIQPPFWANK